MANGKKDSIGATGRFNRNITVAEPKGKQTYLTKGGPKTKGTISGQTPTIVDTAKQIYDYGSNLGKYLHPSKNGKNGK